MTRWIDRTAGYLVVAATLPYLALKVLWLSGHPVGVTNLAVVEDTGMRVANAATLGLDAAALVVALTLTHRWGLRVPAALVLLPSWVGTGLLAPVAVIMPVTAAIVTGGGHVLGPADPVAPWVYTMVYSAFFCEGVGLIVLFARYARRRWADLFGPRLGEWPRGATHRLQVTLGVTVAALAVVTGTTQLAWAAGVRSGLPGRVLADRAGSWWVVEGTHGAFALLAAAGLLALVLRRPARSRLWIALVAAWTGTGATFAWGTWGMVNILSASVLAGQGPGAAVNLVEFGVTLAGLVGGLTGAFALAERPARAPLAGGPADAPLAAGRSATMAS